MRYAHFLGELADQPRKMFVGVGKGCVVEGGQPTKGRSLLVGSPVGLLPCVRLRFKCKCFLVCMRVRLPRPCSRRMPHYALCVASRCAQKRGWILWGDTALADWNRDNNSCSVQCWSEKISSDAFCWNWKKFCGVSKKTRDVCWSSHTMSSVRSFN